jgi:hypothetical protein
MLRNLAIAITCALALGCENGPEAQAPEAQADKPAAAARPDVVANAGHAKTFADASTCEAKKVAMKAWLADLPTSCSDDADCTVFLPGCPFGCGTPVRSDADLTSLREAVEDWDRECEECDYKCMVGTPECIDGVCKAQ